MGRSPSCFFLQQEQVHELLIVIVALMVGGWASINDGGKAALSFAIAHRQYTVMLPHCGMTDLRVFVDQRRITLIQGVAAFLH